MALRNDRPDRIERQTIDGTEAKVALYAEYPHPSFEKRVEIEHDGACWTFGIDDDETASVVAQTGTADEIPDWITDSFRSMGVEVDV